MNERILELAKQAGLKFPSESALSPAEQKFAELLIQECLTFVEPYPGSGDIDDIALGAARDSIKEHFGVE